MREGAMLGAAAFALFAAAPAPAQTAAPDYSDRKSWLCLPSRDDSCSRPLPTAALNPNGYGSVGQSVPNKAAAIDCFYVYPTVSRDASPNSDLKPGGEEQAAATNQFARYASVCRPFAPLYRQVTLAALQSTMTGKPQGDVALAYGDVRAAWRHYLDHYNQGRPFVLIGHSQGTLMLSQLLARDIEGTPVADRMLSALLIGYNVEVPHGKTVGGTFKQTPLCTRAGQTGCVVTFVSFRASDPPPRGARFGRTSTPGMTVACTNPARLTGGSALLDSYWYAGPSPSMAHDPIVWSRQGPSPAAYVRTHGLVSATCINRGNVGYLSVLVNADPADARTGRIPGDVVTNGVLQRGWGLHLADMSIAMGDLISLIQEQARAFRR